MIGASWKAGLMESVLVAAVTGVLTLVGVLVSNSRSRAVMEYKLDELASKVEAHNRVIERTYALEARCSVIENDVVTLYKRTGKEE